MTISHYELPFALTEKYNGWASRELIDLYVRYCEAIFTRYKDKVKYWLTFNEINCGTLPLGNFMGLGILNEGTRDFANQVDDPQLRYQALHHMFVASARAVQLGHRINPAFKIGCMIAYMTNYPYSCNPKDVIACQEKNDEANYYCGDVQVRGAYPHFAQSIWNKYEVELQVEDGDLEELKRGTVDFYSFSYYMSNAVATGADVEEAAATCWAGQRILISRRAIGGGRSIPMACAIRSKKVYGGMRFSAHGCRERLGRLRRR